jgi:hypothetical protein
MSYTVTAINDRKVNTKFGEKLSYTFMANGERFNLGFNKPAFKVGDTIEFTFTEGSYGKDVEKGTVRVIAKGAPGVPAAAPSPTNDGPSAPAAAGRSYGPPSRPFPIPLLHGDRAIIRQNSLTNAVKLFTDSTDGDTIIKMTSSELIESVLLIAREFEEYSAGDAERRAAEKGDE